MRSLVLCSLSSSVNRTHVVSVDPLGQQYTRNRPNFSLILIFKTLANGHVFITSQRSHRTSEGVNTGGVCVCVCGRCSWTGWNGTGWAVASARRPFVTHMPAVSPETGDKHTTGGGHVFPKRAGDPRSTPAPLKHANVPVLCSNWSQ